MRLSSSFLRACTTVKERLLGAVASGDGPKQTRSLPGNTPSAALGQLRSARRRRAAVTAFQYEMVQLTIDGQPVRVPAGSTVAAALVRAGRVATRHSLEGEPRAPLCGMGVCYECRVTIGGRPHCLACRTICTEGLQVETT